MVILNSNWSSFIRCYHSKYFVQSLIEKSALLPTGLTSAIFQQLISVVPLYFIVGIELIRVRILTTPLYVPHCHSVFTAKSKRINRYQAYVNHHNDARLFTWNHKLLLQLCNFMSE